MHTPINLRYKCLVNIKGRERRLVRSKLHRRFIACQKWVLLLLVSYFCNCVVWLFLDLFLCIVVCLVPASRPCTLSFLSTLSKFDSACRWLLRLPVLLFCLTSSRISTALKNFKILRHPLDEAVFGLKSGMLGLIYLLLLSYAWRWIISIFNRTSQVNFLGILPGVSRWILSVFFSIFHI